MKVSTLPCHEYENNLCFLWGGEKLGRPILPPPWQDEASTLCRWLSGWRKTWLIRYFPTLTSESINLTTLPCHEYANNLCLLVGREKLGQPILSPPRQDKASTWCRWLSEWRKTQLVCYFPTLTSESIKLTLSWIHIQPLLIRGWGKLGRPILSPPWQNKASACCRWLSGWRKTWLVHYFPTLTSESINLNLPWIHIQPLLFRGCGKTGPAQSSTTLTSESINLVQKLGYLGEKKLGWPILSPPPLVKVSALPCHEYANNLCFLGGGENLGLPIFSPPWLV